MKTIPALCSFAVALMMVSCVSPIVKRIEHNPELFNALSARHKDMVQQGRIEEGMTKKAVFIAWGKPDRASKGSQNGKAFERWSYAGYDAVYTAGWGMGLGAGYYHSHGCGGGGYFYEPSFLYEPMINYVPYEAAKVQFTNGIVTAWSISP